MKNISLIFVCFLAANLLLNSACKKEDSPDENTPLTHANLTIQLNHRADGILIQFDSILYQNKAGNKYSLTRLQYYISGLVLTKSNEEKVQLSSVFYVDGRVKNQVLTLSEVPIGSYKSIQFLIGLNPSQNISNSLENTADNINMQWPEVIGGGYHFLKFEGYYLDTINLKQGFTMHIGTNEMLVQHVALPINFSITENHTQNLHLPMNINEWFKNPYSYDFNKDGNYTMAIPSLMTILKNNGNDVFTIQE
jgi:hypothetical protein